VYEKTLQLLKPGSVTHCVPGTAPNAGAGTVPDVAPFALYVYIGLKIAKRVKVPVLV
jgi:hypothetical protein